MLDRKSPKESFRRVKYVIIPKDQYLELLDDSQFLDALIDRDVESWEGYSEVARDFYGIEEVDCDEFEE